MKSKLFCNILISALTYKFITFKPTFLVFFILTNTQYISENQDHCLSVSMITIAFILLLTFSLSFVFILIYYTFLFLYCLL